MGKKLETLFGDSIKAARVLIPEIDSELFAFELYCNKIQNEATEDEDGKDQDSLNDAETFIKYCDDNKEDGDKVLKIIEKKIKSFIPKKPKKMKKRIKKL